MSPVPSGTNRNRAIALLELLREQRAMADQLVSLAQSQAAIIAEGLTDRLLDVLARRQTIIDAFTQSQNRLADLTRGLDSEPNITSPSNREQIKSLIDEISTRLAQVMQQDAEDQSALCSGRDQVRRELSTLGAARQARGAYRTQPGTDARFADRHG